MAARSTTSETYSNGQLVEAQTVTYEVSSEQINDETIRAQASGALATNRTYVASTPTAAQTTAQVKALSRQNNGLIRLLLGLLDGTD